MLALGLSASLGEMSAYIRCEFEAFAESKPTVSTILFSENLSIRRNHGISSVLVRCALSCHDAHCDFWSMSNQEKVALYQHFLFNCGRLVVFRVFTSYFLEIATPSQNTCKKELRHRYKSNIRIEKNSGSKGEFLDCAKKST